MNKSRRALIIAGAVTALLARLPIAAKAATTIIVDPEPNNVAASETITLVNRDALSIGGRLGDILSQQRRGRQIRDRKDLYAFRMVAPSKVFFDFATVQSAEGHDIRVKLVQDDNRNRRIDSGEATIALINNGQPQSEVLASGDYIAAAEYVSPKATFAYDLLIERLNRLD